MIEINELDFAYDNNVRLFDNLALNIGSGGIYGLLGKNGAGKTSLLKIMAGLLFAQQGQCRVHNESAQLRLPSLLAETFLLMEEIQLPKISIVAYLNLYANAYPRFDQALFYDCLKEFAVKTSELLTALSYGQKKKFLISFALATRCKLLLLDEPTNGLDIPSKAQFKRLLAKNFMEEQAIIISTHQVHDIEQMIDQIIILEQGKIIFQESLDIVSTRFSFLQQSQQPDERKCLYFEEAAMGYQVISPNAGAPSEVNLELLFNAVLSEKSRFQS